MGRSQRREIAFSPPPIHIIESIRCFLPSRDAVHVSGRVRRTVCRPRCDETHRLCSPTFHVYFLTKKDKKKEQGEQCTPSANIRDDRLKEQRSTSKYNQARTINTNHENERVTNHAGASCLSTRSIPRMQQANRSDVQGA